jgi:hypothetical protein
MVSRMFARMATTTYSTKRNQAGSSRVTKAVTVLAAILGTPLVPASVEILDQYRVQSPRQHYLAYFEGAPNILSGDFLSLSGVDYPVRGVGRWPSDNAFFEVLVEEIK